MSIYFFHFLTIFLPLSFILAVLLRFERQIYAVFIALFLGFLFGYFSFYIAKVYIRTDELSFYTQALLILFLILSFVFSFFTNFTRFKIFLTAVLSFCFAVKYYILSQDFPIFSSTLLDSSAIISLGFICLACMICLFCFFFVRWQSLFQSKLSLIILAIFIFLEVNLLCADIFKIGFRKDLIEASTLLISFVAKTQFYLRFVAYFYMFLILLLAILSLRFKFKNPEKSHKLDIIYRKQSAKNHTINSFFIFTFLFLFIGVGVILHFQLIASRPISIDPPQEIVPNADDEFVFDIQLLRDNDLHRFSYVTGEGKVVRFFLINKREDRDSPVAVFDACRICGDMGYVKHNGELICVACNVRIFLPSVGKDGGCNPIPLAYEFDGQKVRIKLEDVIAGSNHFSEIKELLVKDPVSGAELINLKAPYSYTYAGFSYYFENEQNYEKFKEDPQQYVKNKQIIKYKVNDF
ncbi:DUF2318 domain-containing protein [Campylobacter sp. MIT 99-7217]|uniref:Fe-S-containing protein n=1 Tax=Campylobacter sp. MIT 99-7217 TaxID=535091 RepID=UPI001159198C|nr:Fe-S-containing protein [Campylobacter sp. MIT 99-7217]TQR29522.1 DUF2318 domain-containing protein [Campylobacter sp. MIT 99-7217]